MHAHIQNINDIQLHITTWVKGKIKESNEAVKVSIKKLLIRIRQLNVERRDGYETEWHLVMLVCYVNINTPVYLKCSLEMVLVIATIG